MISSLSLPSLGRFLILSSLFSSASAQLWGNWLGGLSLSSPTTIKLGSDGYSASYSSPPVTDSTPGSFPYSTPPSQPKKTTPKIIPQPDRPAHNRGHKHKPIPVAKPVPASGSDSTSKSPPPTYGSPPKHPYPIPAAKPVPVSTPYTSPHPTPSQPHPVTGSHQADIDGWLDSHNVERMRYGAPNVTWNPDLVIAASQRAATCYFKHTPNNRYGENIAAGQGSLQEVCNDWANGHNEKDIYNPNGGIGSDTHWTQMVWDTTREIGCCYQTCEQMEGVSLGPGPIKYWVCEYHPAGNVIGQSSEHVRAGEGGAPLPPSQSEAGPAAVSQYAQSRNIPAYGFPMRRTRHRRARLLGMYHKL
ncbi:hypothetical protein CROQUDRAFT_674002 [Cronartium quercuum f. sp. fusiforme G11]|uniref:SCP domain-containing protein n=1 Tax=Cronartium quercuum f. sp. fusiforme G11 TaxID=708437 RepID=A0A9P6NDC0_9BASI|nr:hypothetical protein CROQUDRAFT_674002 [Cronartium quercuum f. sp. fusiforme G11]